MNKNRRDWVRHQRAVKRCHRIARSVQLRVCKSCAIDVKPNYPFHCRSFANATFDESAWDVRETRQPGKCLRVVSFSSWFQFQSPWQVPSCSCSWQSWRRVRANRSNKDRLKKKVNHKWITQRMSAIMQKYSSMTPPSHWSTRLLLLRKKERTLTVWYLLSLSSHH